MGLPLLICLFSLRPVLRHSSAGSATCATTRRSLRSLLVYSSSASFFSPTLKDCAYGAYTPRHTTCAIVAAFVLTHSHAHVDQLRLTTVLLSFATAQVRVYLSVRSVSNSYRLKRHTVTLSLRLSARALRVVVDSCLLQSLPLRRGDLPCGQLTVLRYCA